jgi:hypothetical protein
MTETHVKAHQGSSNSAFPFYRLGNEIDNPGGGDFSKVTKKL